MTIRFEAVELMPDRFWFCAVDPAAQRFWEVGGCAPMARCIYCRGTGTDPTDETLDCPRCEGKCSVRVLAPCDGHPNQTDAFLHWATWLADTAERKHAKEYNVCSVRDCGHLTAQLAQLQHGRSVPLCARHSQSREFLIELLLRDEVLSRFSERTSV